MEILNIPELISADVALGMLRRLSDEFTPLIEKRGYRVLSLSELCCCGDGYQTMNWGYRVSEESALDSTMGFNQCQGSVEKGSAVHRIHIRLRRPHSHASFVPWADVVRAMAHELAHCVHMDHSDAFWTLMDEILDQHATFLVGGVVTDADGLSASDNVGSAHVRVLGGRRDMVRTTDMGRVALERERRAAGRYWTAPRRLGTGGGSGSGSGSGGGGRGGGAAQSEDAGDDSKEDGTTDRRPQRQNQRQNQRRRGRPRESERERRRRTREAAARAAEARMMAAMAPCAVARRQGEEWACSCDGCGGAKAAADAETETETETETCRPCAPLVAASERMGGGGGGGGGGAREISDEAGFGNRRDQEEVGDDDYDDTAVAGVERPTAVLELNDGTGHVSVRASSPGKEEKEAIVSSESGDEDEMKISATVTVDADACADADADADADAGSDTEAKAEAEAEAEATSLSSPDGSPSRGTDRDYGMGSIFGGGGGGGDDDGDYDDDGGGNENDNDNGNNNDELLALALARAQEEEKAREASLRSATWEVERSLAQFGFNIYGAERRRTTRADLR